MTRTRTWTLACCAVALTVTGACSAVGGDAVVEGGSAPASGTSSSPAPASPGVLLTVTGDVGLVFGEHAFEVGVRGADGVLVVSLERPFPTRRGVRVRVTGVVEPLRVAVLRERGLREEAVRLAGFEGRDSLVASTVEVSEYGGG